MHYSSSTSSLATSMKITTPIRIRNFILNSVTRVLTKSKSFLIEAVEELQNLNNIHILVPLIFKKNRNKKNKLYLGSFRFHYNWSSSNNYIIPKSSIQNDGFNRYVYYYDNSKWDNSFEDQEVVAPVGDSHRLSGYLHWLDDQEKNEVVDTNHEIVEINEIDDLAEKFIANCRGKFVLEKQESDRKFQEMMARSL